MFNYKENEILSMPLPSSGGILLAQMLKMSSFENLRNHRHNSPEAVQIMVEAERRACADRAECMSDTKFAEDKTQILTSDDYLKKRCANFDRNWATPRAAVGQITKQPEDSTESTHISILDREGNAVAVTTT